jgi:hypothetical protein
MLKRKWPIILLLIAVSAAGCSRRSRPAFTIEGAKKELRELEAARKKEWTPPDQ